MFIFTVVIGVFLFSDQTRALKQKQMESMMRVARIIAVADCFDAMYSDRTYRKRMDFDRAVSIIRDISGTQLSPDVVDAFMSLIDKGEIARIDT